MTWPALNVGLGAELMAVQRQYDASQWWPLETLLAEQFRQLRHLVAHAAAHIPFHRERLHAAGIDPAQPITPESWARLPVLTRRDLQDAGAALFAASIPASHGPIAESASGGSTGIPVRVRKSGLDAFLWNASQVREEIWHRKDVTGLYARIRRAPDTLPAEHLARTRTPHGLRLQDWGAPLSLIWNTGPLVMFDIDQPIAAQAEFLRTTRPQYLSTPPSNLRLLAAHCRDHGLDIHLDSVWTRSEIVDPSLRDLCQAAFGAQIIDNYSAAETGYIALQCPEYPHFHVQAETMLVEVLDAAGRACAAGETGRVVVTPLHNFATPLLRYEIGDEAVAGAPCPCGRGLPVLEAIIGRTLDHLTLPDGRKRRVDFRHYRLSRIHAVREFQIVQRSLSEIEIRLVVSRTLTDAEVATVHQIARAEFGADFSLTLTYHPSLPRTAADKLRPFVSELPKQA